ncbi:MAG: hypothetical protein ABJC63_16365, partial [Gemmatimonadales bacterium]
IQTHRLTAGRCNRPSKRESILYRVKVTMPTYGLLVFVKLSPELFGIQPRRSRSSSCWLECLLSANG